MSYPQARAVAAAFVNEEIQHLTKLRNHATVSMLPASGHLESARAYYEGKRDAYEAALSALTRLKNSIAQGGERQ